MVGHMRTFELVADSLLNNVIRANSEHTFDVYVHTWKCLGYSRTQATDTKAEIHQKLIQKFGMSYHHDTSSGDIDVDKIKSVLSPREMVVETDEDLQREVYDKLSTPRDSQSFYPNTYAQFRKLYLCHKLMQDSGIAYDIVVKIRPDVNYTAPMIFSEMPSQSLILHDSYVNDHVYYGPPDTMEILANMFTGLDPSSRMDPHQILCQTIRSNNILYFKRRLDIELMRQDGKSYAFNLGTSSI